MAGDWIKLETATPDKPEVMLLANRLGISQAEAFLSIIRLFIWADTHVIDGAVPFLSPTQVDTLSKATAGTCEALAAPEIRWLDVEDNEVRFMNWDRHNGRSAKQRVSETDKKRRQRSKQASCPPSCPDQNGTSKGQKGGLEKRREEINTSLSSATGDGTWFEGYSADFERWWDCLPTGMRTGKRSAWEFWRKAVIDVQSSIGCDESAAITHLIQRMTLFAKSPRGQSAAFRWSPTTFLKEGHYEDSVESWEITHDDANQGRARRVRSKHPRSNEINDKLAKLELETA